MKTLKYYNDFINENLNNKKEVEELVSVIFDEIKADFNIENFKKKANSIGIHEYEYTTSKNDKLKITQDKVYINNDELEISEKLFSKMKEFFKDIEENEENLKIDKKSKDILDKYKKKYIKKYHKEKDEDIDEEDTNDTKDEDTDEQDTDVKSEDSNDDKKSKNDDSEA